MTHESGKRNVPDQKGAGDTERGKEPRGDLFEEPKARRIRDISTDIDKLLRAIGEGSVSKLHVGQLDEALQDIHELQAAVSRASDRLVASVVDPLVQLAELGKQLSASARIGVQVQLSPMLALSQRISAMMDSYQAAYQALVATYLAPLQQALGRFAESFRPLLDEISRAQVRQLEYLLRRHHWWPVPGMPVAFYKGILALVQQGQTRRINRYICDWFRWNRYRRLGRMVKRWDRNEYFCRRRHIYNQALKSHRRGWYNLTVPALVPLVEGVARDYLEEKHGVSERSGKKAIEKALGKSISTDVYREEMQQALVRFLTSSTFADTDRNDVLRSGYDLNRHGVAHSRHLRYGTEANSLRCFMLLETLYQFIAEDPGTSWV